MKQTVYLKYDSAVTNRIYLAEMPVGWRLSPPAAGEESEISREEFEATPKKEVCAILVDGERRMLFEATT